MTLRFLFYLFIFYLLYKLVFDFILPVYRTTKQVKKGFREMNARMQQQSAPGDVGHQSTVSQKQPPAAGSKGDYIDFEEIKD